MKKVIVKFKNEIISIATLEDPTEWVAKQEAKGSWGKKDRWVRELEGDHYTDSRVIEGELETYTEYFYPQKYEITIKDITLEYEAEQEKETNRILAMKKMKKEKRKTRSLPELNIAFDKLLESLGY